MELDKPRHLHKQVADQLRAAIERGDYAPGSTLPSQPELARQLGIAQTSVSKGIRILKREGLVTASGTSTIVRPLPVLPRYAVTRSTVTSREAGGARGAFDAEMRKFGLTPRVELTERGQVPAPSDAAQRLHLAEGAPVAIRARQMFANNHPVLIAVSYIPWQFAEGTAILEEDTGPGGIYSRLTEQGHKPVRFTESVRLRTPTDTETRFLQLDEEQQVYVAPRVAWDSEDQPVEVNIQVLPPHLWELHYEWPADPS